MASEHELAIFALRKEKARLRLAASERIRQCKASKRSEFGIRTGAARATLNIMNEQEAQQRQLDAAIQKLMT